MKSLIKSLVLLISLQAIKTEDSEGQDPKEIIVFVPVPAPVAPLPVTPPPPVATAPPPPATVCKTVSGPVVGGTCVFPFTFRGVSYTGCTTADGGQPWCSTRVDSSGRHIQGNWGNCAAS